MKEARQKEEEDLLITNKLRTTNQTNYWDVYSLAASDLPIVELEPIFAMYLPLP